MDKIFDSHWALRITSVILALALFFYVQSLPSGDNRETIASTQTDVIENVPLEAYYDENNLIVTGIPETVDVTIEGPTQLVMEAKLLKDYEVFVDLDSLLIGEHSVTIQTENFSDKLTVTIDPKIINISIEERISKEFKVEPQLNSNQISESLILDSMSVVPEKIVLTGAKSVIDSVSYVKANVKVDEEIKESFTSNSNVVVLNKDLNKLDVGIDPKTVDVSVEVKPYTKSIPIILEVEGDVDRIGLENIQLLKDTVEVVGAKSVVDGLSEIIAKINVDEITKSGEYKVKLTLPNGITTKSNNPIKVKVNVPDAIDEEVLSPDEE